MSAAREPSFFFGSRAGYLRLAGLSLIIVEICLVLAFHFDQDIALAIRDGLSKETRRAFLPITELGKADWYLAFIVIAYVIGRFGFLRASPLPVASAWYALSRAATFMAAGLGFAAVIVHVLKLSVGRARPKALFRDDFYGAEPFAFDLDLNSFPSGHSQTIWCLMTALILIFPRGWPLFVLWALTVSSSRIIVGAHFPSDVLMGSFIAILSVLFVRWRWFSDVKAPNFHQYIVPAPKKNEEQGS